MSEQVANVPQSILVGAIASGDSSLVVASATLFSTTGFFRIKIDQELIGVATVSGTTFSSLTRGLEGTTAAAHANGALVTQVLTAAGLLALIMENAGGGGSNVFVYREGASPAGNVYSSFATALAARAATQGFAILQIDDSLGSPNVPAGTYAIPDGTRFYGTWNANGSGSLPSLECAAGATFTGDLTDFENVNFLTNNSSTPDVTLNNAQVVVTVRAGSLQTDSASQPVYALVNSQVTLYLYEAAVLFPNSGTVISVDGGSQLTIEMFDGAILYPGVISGTGAVNVTYDDSCTVYAQGGFSGSFNTTLRSQAPAVSYSPGTPGDWTSPPAQVAEALDDLAARGTSPGFSTSAGTTQSVSASSGGASQIFGGPISLVPSGTALLVTARCSGQVQPACFRLIPTLEYSVDGGVTYTVFLTARGSGIPSDGAYTASGIDVAISLTGWITGLTPGVAVYVRFRIVAFGASGSYSSGVGDDTTANVITITDFAS
jgi:hypothetical protein